MAYSTLSNFNEDKKVNIITEDISEEWNISEDLLLEGTVAQNAEYPEGNFDNTPKNSWNIQRNFRKKFNTTFVK